MRARFASVVGTPIGPAGTLTVQGDFYHLPGGRLEIDLAGNSAGDSYDVVNVIGAVELAGDLAVSLADVGGSPFSPALNSSFDILTATQGITGQFEDVMLPQLPWNLDWSLNYSNNAVTLTAFTSGDFNKNGVVDTADYVVWRQNNGSQTEYNAWRNNFGRNVSMAAASFSGSATSTAVPEPASQILLALSVMLTLVSELFGAFGKASRMSL
jgi:hypothetical protein